jgi:hypothetical protein
MTQARDATNLGSIVAVDLELRVELPAPEMRTADAAAIAAYPTLPRLVLAPVTRVTAR